MKLNVAVIGSGGREDALCWKLSCSPLLNNLYALPGNFGTSRWGENYDIDALDLKKIVGFCSEKKIDLVIVGPEVPLVHGIKDELDTHGIKVFGPSKLAAEIEGSKAFAKNFMKKYNIPTAEYTIFSNGQKDLIDDYLEKIKYPTVIKADGLAAGKGVIICDDNKNAKDEVNQIFLEKKFGSAGEKIVIEEFLSGEEVSVFVITDGENFVLMNPAQDYKKIGNGDTGKNTGGMGAFSFESILTPSEKDEIIANIIKPTLEGMKREGRKYTGCLYCGLIKTKSGIKVIEYNCRFGDPETQAVLQTLESDLLQLFYESTIGGLSQVKVQNIGSAICLVLASEGYPEKFEKEFEISGIEEAEKLENIKIFHAGTKRVNNKIVTNGGRVLNVTATSQSENFEKLIKQVYEAASIISYKNKYNRKDIGIKGINKFL
ncbi:MAG: phosphoribosylamine--glycine ligase [Ignavibacteria bacterium]|nr:phosphoribosylamine--glycine ligase [Ignavibacteria bacterium]